MCIERALERLTNITGTSKFSKKSLTTTISKAVSDLKNSFTELKSALEKKIGENEQIMETVKTITICNQEATMLETSRSTEEQEVAGIKKHRLGIKAIRHLVTQMQTPTATNLNLNLNPTPLYMQH